MNELTKIKADFEEFVSWLETLLGHAKANTLPTAPTAASGPVVIGVAATPATEAESLVGQKVPGADMPDVNGAIAIPGIANKFYPPNSRFQTVVSLPYIDPDSAAAYAVMVNCHNITFLHGAFVGGRGSPTFEDYKPPVVVANPAGSALPFHSSGNVPGEKLEIVPNVVVIPSTFDTIDKIVAYAATLPVYGISETTPPVAGPGQRNQFPNRKG